MPARAFIDSDGHDHHGRQWYQYVIMPARAWFDSETADCAEQLMGVYPQKGHD